MASLQEDGLVVLHEKVAQQTYRLRIRSPGIAAEARAGQFVMVQVRKGIDPLLRRPFSFHRLLPAEDSIELLYRVVGRGTWVLSKNPPGTILSLFGPLGNGFLIPSPLPSKVVLVAGGIGIAPFMELLQQLSARRRPGDGPPPRLIYGARTAEELLPMEFLREVGASVSLATDDGSLGYRGTVTQLLSLLAEKEGLEPGLLYACGPLAMQYGVARWVTERGVPAQLSLESLMACGLGACLGCALPAPHPKDPLQSRYVHVCKDGPVFEAGAVEWQKIQGQQTITPTFPFSWDL
ncbi:MAG: dihydroorotate dehydrogenase electron transfer subunit [Syntrophobacteraceae bacterium]|nr:dihydroorotate dehydrogenase electron transfer subunit [Syntrophobacteraceae bacterium]